MGRLEHRLTDYVFIPPTEPLRRNSRFAALTASIGISRIILVFDHGTIVKDWYA